MNTSGGGQNAGAGAFGERIQTAPANFTVGEIGFGPAWSAEDSMAASIIRLEQENQELRAHIALLEEERRILTQQRAPRLTDEEDFVQLTDKGRAWLEGRQ